MKIPSETCIETMPCPERRPTALTLLAVTILFGIGSQSSYAQAAKTAAPSIKAQDFMDIFGVNVHFHDNNYQNVQAIADSLNIIGFSHIRSDCRNEADVAAWKDLAAKCAPYFPHGLKGDLLITSYMNAPDTTFSRQKALIPRISDLIETIEGPNEINNYSVGGGTHGPEDTSDQTKNWRANYLAWAKALYAWKTSTKSLHSVHLVAPDIASGDPADYSRLPNVSRYVDAGNIHFYAGNGRQPSNFGGGNFSAVCDWYKAAATPSKQLTMTEWGQTTAGKPGQGGCDGTTQAKYILNQMCDAVAKGIHRAYIYQLMDGTSDGDPAGNGGTEAHFGIFDYRWHVKPAAQALANVKTLLADSSKNFTLKTPAYTVSGITNGGMAGSSLTIGKSDGSFFIIVWNEPQIWDQKSNAPVTPPNDAVTVDFGRSYTYQVYDPLIGLNAIATGSSSQVRVNVTGSPLWIHISPSG